MIDDLRENFFTFIRAHLRTRGGRAGAGMPVGIVGLMRCRDVVDRLVLGKVRYSHKITREWPPLADWPSGSELLELSQGLTASQLPYAAMTQRALNMWLDYLLSIDEVTAAEVARLRIVTAETRSGVYVFEGMVELLRALEGAYGYKLAAKDCVLLEWGRHVFVDDEDNVVLLPTDADASPSASITVYDARLAELLRDAWRLAPVTTPTYVFGTDTGTQATTGSLQDFFTANNLQRRRYRVGARR